MNTSMKTNGVGSISSICYLITFHITFISLNLQTITMIYKLLSNTSVNAIHTV